MYTVEQFLETCHKEGKNPWQWDFKQCYLNKEDFEKNHSIVNFLKYKNNELIEFEKFNVTGKTGIKADCDKEAYPIYQLLGWQENMEDIIRGETMNSFTTTFNHALRISDNQEQVFDELKIDTPRSPSKYLNVLYTNSNYEKFDVIAKNISKFELFAVNTHTIGNFIVLPHWMNTGRYWFSKDYWDLTLRSMYDFLNPLGAWENFVEKYYLQFFVNEEYIPVELWKDHFSSVVKPTNNQISQFLKNVNLRVEKRGKLLTKILCENINRTDFDFYQEIKDEKIEFSNKLK